MTLLETILIAVLCSCVASAVTFHYADRWAYDEGLAEGFHQARAQQAEHHQDALAVSEEDLPPACNGELATRLKRHTPALPSECHAYPAIINPEA